MLLFRQLAAITPRLRRALDGDAALPWAALAAVGLLLALAWPALSGRVWTADDLGVFHLPLRVFYSQQLTAGEPFDWLPSLYAGFYVTGEGQLGGYHPWHWLLYRTLPVDAAFNLEMISSYLVSLLGMFVFLRRLVTRSGAALFGALVWAWGGFHLLHFVHVNAIAVLAHLPWLMAALDLMFTSRARRYQLVAAAALALGVGSQLLLGYPQYVWFTLLSLFAWGAYRLWAGRHEGSTLLRGPSPWRGRLVAVIAALGMGLLIGAVQLLPTVEALAASDRGELSGDFAFTGSLHPAQLLQWVAPYLTTTRVIGDNTHEFGAYLGAVPLALVLWFLVGGGRASSTAPRSLIAWAVFFTLGALWLALGIYGVLYGVQTLLPLVGKFRMPCRYLCLVQFGVAMLAALALDALLSQRFAHPKETPTSATHSAPSDAARGPLGPLPRPFRWLVGFSLLAPLVGVMAWREALAPWWQVALGPLLIALAVGIIVMAQRGYRLAPALIVLVTALDLGTYGMSYAVYGPSRRMEEYLARGPQPPNLANSTLAASHDTPPRLATELPLAGRKTGRMGNQLAARGARLLGGYAGLEPTCRLNYHTLAALRAASVRAVLRSEESEAIAGLLPLGDAWFAVPDPLPRCYLVEEVRQSAQEAEDLLQIDLSRTALVDRPVDLLPASGAETPQLTTRVPRAPAQQGPAQQSPAQQSPAQQSPAQQSPAQTTHVQTIHVQLIRDRPGQIDARVLSPSRRLLVLTERYHAGWRVMVRGRPVEVVRANGDFIGCVVEAGSSDVAWRFSPAGLSWGRWISGLGIVAAGLCFLGGLLSPRLSDLPFTSLT